MAEQTESEKLAQQIADAAFDLHSLDPAAAEKLIDETVHGTGIWPTAMRGLTKCIYHQRRIKETTHD